MESTNSPQKLMKQYVEEKKEIYVSLLSFLEKSEDSNQSFLSFKETMNKYESTFDCEEITQFLELLNDISSNHRRSPNFITKIIDIVKHYQEQVKANLRNIEIFYIFQNNKIVLYHLFRNGIITKSEKIYKEIINKRDPNGNKYCHFFYPEIKDFAREEERKEIEEELLSNDPNIFEKFDEKRSVGENDSYICSLIREDSLDEFISYIKQTNYSLQSEVTPSIFETNQFLNEGRPRLIEYSSFFGSNQIFKYLSTNNVELTPSIWLYGIHSKSFEFIHLLESFNIELPDKEKKEEEEKKVGKTNNEDENSGEENSEYENSEDENSEDENSGDENSGDENSGEENSGEENSGEENSGEENSGEENNGEESKELTNGDENNNSEERISKKRDGEYIIMESIKCHHNDFVDYFKKNSFEQKSEIIISSIMHYHQYTYFPTNFEEGYEFFYLCFYNYHKLVNLFIQKKENNILNMIIS